MLLTPSFPRRGTWSPTDLGSALAAWWNADDLVDGSDTTWTDRIAGLAPTQATSGSRPVKAAQSLNGCRPGVTFDGVDDNLRISATTGLPTGATAGEIWMLAQCAADGISGTLFSYGITTASASRSIRKNGSNLVLISDNTAGNTGPTVFTGPTIVGGAWSGTTENGWTNGVAHPANPVTIATLNTSTTRTSIGATTGTSPGSFAAVTIRHILVTTALVAAQRQQIEGWMAWDAAAPWQLPSDHPYKLGPP